MEHEHSTTHRENDIRLARIEGQIRGIRRMVDQGAYCMDIITQIEAARAGLKSVSARILRKHLETCVAESFRVESTEQISQKVDEVMKALDKMGR